MTDEPTRISSIWEAIVTRRSIRRYQPDPVPRELVENLLEAAKWAPSAHNRQPWRFALIETQAEKERLALAMGARLRRDLERDHVPVEVIEKDVNRSYDRMTSAPILVIVCLSMADMDSYPDAKRAQNEYLMAVQSTAMSGQNLLLAAHDAGLGACWLCAPLFVPQLVREVLSLPDDWQPQGLITLGYPSESRQKERYSLENRVLWR